jgi:hypothetical protein
LAVIQESQQLIGSSGFGVGLIGQKCVSVGSKNGLSNKRNEPDFELLPRSGYQRKHHRLACKHAIISGLFAQSLIGKYRSQH